MEHPERFTELHREGKREEGDRRDQVEKRGESKGERPVQPVISCLSVLHSPEHPERFIEFREEKGEGGERLNCGRKGRDKRESNQVSNHTSK